MSILEVIGFPADVHAGTMNIRQERAALAARALLLELGSSAPVIHRLPNGIGYVAPNTRRVHGPLERMRAVAGTATYLDGNLKRARVLLECYRSRPAGARTMPIDTGAVHGPNATATFGGITVRTVGGPVFGLEQ